MKLCAGFAILFLVWSISLAVANDTSFNDLNLNMKSGYREAKDAAFLITPDDFRNIVRQLNDFQNRLDNKTVLIYTISYKDNTFHQTTDMNEFLNDVNPISNYIDYILIEMRVLHEDDPKSKQVFAEIHLSCVNRKGAVLVNFKNPIRENVILLAKQIEDELGVIYQDHSIPRVWIFVFVLSLTILSIKVISTRKRITMKETLNNIYHSCPKQM